LRSAQLYTEGEDNDRRDCKGIAVVGAGRIGYALALNATVLPSAKLE
jgi:hypothetical protein